MPVTTSHFKMKQTRPDAQSFMVWATFSEEGMCVKYYGDSKPIALMRREASLSTTVCTLVFLLPWELLILFLIEFLFTSTGSSDIFLQILLCGYWKKIYICATRIPALYIFHAWSYIETWLNCSIFPINLINMFCVTLMKAWDELVRSIR